MQRAQFIIQPAFGFMNPINAYWSHKYQCAMQFYLNENSTRFGCREGDSFALLCLSLAALKGVLLTTYKGCNCHIICPGPQATSACHHPCDKAIYVLKGAESRAAQLHSLNSFCSQFSPKPMAEWLSQFIELLSWFYVPQVPGSWKLSLLGKQSPSCLTGENRNLLPGLLLSSQ